MEKFTLSKISKADLKRFVKLEKNGIDSYDWLNVESITLTESEQQQLYYLQSHLLNYSIHFMNEATILARGIYPFLLLAEQGKIQAWSEIPLQAKYSQFELEGIADRVLAKTVSDSGEVPYLVVEAKKGLENQKKIKRRFGEILPNLERKIRQFSMKKLEELGESLFNFSTMTYLISWLKNN